MASMPIKIYKDRVETTTLSTTNLTVTGTISGISASAIGAASATEFSNLSTTVGNLSSTVTNNYSTLNNKFSSYLPLSGGTLSGILKWSNTLTKVNSPTILAAFIDNDSKNGLGYANTSDLNVSSAASATKLTTNAGNESQPIYFANGIPVACGDSLAVNITGNASKSTNSDSCTGNAATATKLQTGRTFKVNLALTSASTAFDGSAAINDIGVNGILKEANGGTGVSSLYENITITPNLGTLVSGSYARYYPHLKLVVISAQLSGVTISTTGSGVSLLTLSNYGTQSDINIGVAAYTSVGGAVNNCYISGKTISLNVSKALSSKNVGISVAYLIG